MPKNLIENASSYPATVTVPEGGDTHATLAESIEAIAQALADRTAWLKAILGRANVWTWTQLWDTAQNPDVGIFESARTPLECNVTGTPAPANPWRRICKLPTGMVPGMNVALYWGIGAEFGYLLATYNAYWRPHNQRFRQEVASEPSFALLVTGESVSMVRVPAGTADWSEWNTHGRIHVKSVYADAFRFNDGTVNHRTQLPLSSAFGPVSAVLLRTDNHVMFDASLDSTALSKGIKWHVPLLPNNRIGSIHIAFSIANAGDTFQWYRRRQLPDYSTSYSSVGAAVTTDGLNMAYATVFEPAGIQDGDEYELVWKLQDSSNAAQVNANKVYGLQRNWDQSGPMGGGW